MSDRDTIRMALYDAIDWQTSLSEAYGRDDPERKEALNMAAKYRKLLKRRYAIVKTPMESLSDDCETLTLDQVKARFPSP